MQRFNFKSAIVASIIATVAMTLWMFFLGIDIMVILGLTAGLSGLMSYAVGGVIHLAVGIFWGVIYAALFEPWFKKLPKFLSGALFSLLPFFVSVLFMGAFLNIIQTAFNAGAMIERTKEQVGCMPAQPSCAPCQVAPDGACPKHCPNPKAKTKCGCMQDSVKLEDASVQKIAASTVCVPCSLCTPCALCPPCNLCMPCSPCNPCPIMQPDQNANPCAMQKPTTPQANPCAKKKLPKQPTPCQMNPPAKPPVTPCQMQKGMQAGVTNEMMVEVDCKTNAPKEGLPMWVWSFLNHLIFGVVLALAYKPHRSKE